MAEPKKKRPALPKKEELAAEIERLYALLDASHIPYERAAWMASPAEKSAVRTEPKAETQPEKAQKEKISKEEIPSLEAASPKETKQAENAPEHADVRSSDTGSSRQNEGAAIEIEKPTEAELSRQAVSTWKRMSEPALTLEYANLFLSYFKGRDGGWRLRSRNGYFYVPCNRRFEPDCPKNEAGARRIDCMQCAKRPLAPLSPKTLRDHFANREDVAITPILDDGTIAFASITLKGEDRYEQMEQIVCYASMQGIDTLCELRISHVSVDRDSLRLWFFFEIPIDANRASRFVLSLLLNAYAEGILQSTEAFDGIFPAGAMLEKNSFGGTLELPLRGLFTGRAGNPDADWQDSAFLNEDGSLAQNPFERLSLVHRVSLKTADLQIRQTRDNRCERLFEEDPKAILQPTAMPQPVLDLFSSMAEQAESSQKSENKLAGPVRIEQRERLRVRADQFSAPMQAEIRSLACYWNPEYTKKKAKYTNGSRVIALGRVETDTDGIRWLSLPRALLDTLESYFQSRNIDYAVEDLRSDPPELGLSFTEKLRPEQVPLQAALLQKENGILQAATGTGKTVIGASLIAKKKTPTLVLVNSKEILQGWVGALNRFLRFDDPAFESWKAPSKNYPGKIGVLQGATNTLNGRVDLAMVPSLYGRKDLDSILSNYGMVLVDECHHASATTYQQVLDHVPSRYVYGFSATPERTDRKSPSMYWQLGGIAASFSSKDQMAGQSFFRLVCPRFTSFMSDDVQENDFLRLCQEASLHPLRNAQIIDDVKEALENGRTVLVLTRFVEHARLLARLLEPDENTDLLIYAGDPKEKQVNAARLKVITAAKKGGGPARKTVLIGTYASVSEGFDFPDLDTLMLALPIHSKTSVSQSIGRIHRQTEGKDTAIVYDYADVQTPMFERMYRDRLQEYIKQGYQIGTPESSQNTDRNGQYYLEETWKDPLLTDLRKAKTRIALCARYLDGNQARILVPLLSKAANRGVRVDLFLEEASEVLRQVFWQAGLHLHLHPRVTAPCLIIDQEIIWYGTLFTAASMSGGLLRLVSRRDADELLDVRRREELRLIQLQKKKEKTGR